MHYNDGFFGGMHLIWWLVWIVFLIWILMGPAGLVYKGIKGDEPLDILKKRFARGEISKEEFEESKKLLKSDK